VKAFLRTLAAGALLLPMLAPAHLILVISPTHRQTFAYGSERHQAWLARGDDRHLALSAEFTNDPYVDQVNPRQYDDFIFDFPDVRLGTDGRTFYYHRAGGRPVAVARRFRDFLGIDEVKLLPNAELVIKSPHGYLSLNLLMDDEGFAMSAL
jgi:hypothetical protein